MALRVTSWLMRPGLVRALIQHLRLATRLLREPSVPLLTKAVPFLTAAYVVSPVDLLPDLFPVLGQLDDLTVMLAALVIFVSLCPVEAVAFHRTAIAQGRTCSPMASGAGEIIDAEWRHE